MALRRDNNRRYCKFFAGNQPTLNKHNMTIKSLQKKLLILIIGLVGIIAEAQATTPIIATNSVSVVRMQTSMGLIDIKLYNEAAPLTVANFLGYVNSGAFNQSFIHRSVPGFIIQGGGYFLNGTSPTPIDTSIRTATPLINEFSASRSNLRGSIAMAKVGGDPNSATSGWFFNLADNSANLDSQNGGFTVFGQVIDKSLAVVDAIAALPIASSAFTALKCSSVPFSGTALSDLPLAPPTPATCSVKTSNLVTLSSVSSSQSSANDSDRIFAYLEGAYPEYISPANSLSPTSPVSSTAAEYYYRYYPKTNSYVATANGTVYYLGSALGNNQIFTVGALSDWLAAAIAAGY
ncbi:MAG: hypothetical protein RI893_1155 [Pseudomonadota bacterium]|jgi:cyclophilin family peptidyl-prolyl cis-trans isomerase